MAEGSTDRIAAIAGLLDDGLVSGRHETVTVLRPERCARPVVTDDLPRALEEIEFACQVWGGGSQPLIPVTNGQMPDAYSRRLSTEQIDVVGGLQVLDLELPRRVEARHPWNHPALLVAASEPIERWRAVEVTELGADDPWRPIYNAVLGSWPAEPDTRLLDFAFLRKDLRFEEIIGVERVAVEGTLNDLIERTSDRARFSPRQVANVFLASGLEPDTSFMGHGQEVLPSRRAVRRAAGPNLIVALTAGSVEDLALLWNLRGAHGFSRVMPIGIPVEAITPASLRELQEPGRATMFGWSGGACHLVSASIELDVLEEIASQSPSVKAVNYETVLTFGPAPGRVRSRVCLWEHGRTRLEPMSDADRDVLRESAAAVRAPELVIDVTVEDYPIPADPTMRGSHVFGRFQSGSAQVSVHGLRRDETVEVHWPSPWTALAAVAQSRGLDVAPSDPGLAAATLLRALGSVESVYLLRHRPLLELVYRMAERSGMSWWKKRWTRVHGELQEAGADPTTLEKTAVLLGRDEPAVAPQGEGRAVGFQEFVRALGGESAAAHWVAWAERRHLLVRGADITCPHCKTKSWLPLAALPPPVACPGCGREVAQPYNPRALTFTYRLGEPLRRVLETDSLGHVLALRWFVELFRAPSLVGAHPGVTFTDPGTGKTIGEADVLLLFADGTLVPVEVKRRGAGVDPRTVQLMDALAEALDAPWDAIVVTEPARDVPTLPEFARKLPERPRVLLTDDQLHSEHVFWEMGGNPFEWSPRTGEQDLERQRAYSTWLASTDPDVPWDRVADTLLNRDLGAPRGKRSRHGPGAPSEARSTDEAGLGEAAPDDDPKEPLTG